VLETRVWKTTKLLVTRLALALELAAYASTALDLGYLESRSRYPYLMPMAEITLGDYRVLATPDGLPGIHSSYREHAVLAEEFDLDATAGSLCFFAVGERAGDWPSLVVAQRYDPSGWGFNPGLLIVRETDIVFIGAGTRVLAYKLRPQPSRLWLDQAAIGFWGWSRFGDLIFMSAEIELAAWSIDGRKLWTTYVEPPWTFLVSNEEVHLDVMGDKSSFPAATGPRAG